jgi:hypothetical protein
MIYVDDSRKYPEQLGTVPNPNPAAAWCHLWTDPGNEAELHALAKRMGMRREWFQNKRRFPHYDLVARRRLDAIRLGAVPWSLRDWLRGIKPKEQLTLFGKGRRAL